ncbi:hypothetical protein [Pontivivens insulae]|uniref:Uncharacterized protein n=1 Tax=Pontivivens insulae TaxID=1639689 RepID=A0A2R8ABP6_9RHOB|nr:hypothetical protein [Pontivivens insulae]RED11322.1 hypothetical protein DFR53_3357 [Pontivivens insulae]SPF29505.1 hypothetical protein POI8812_01816 [Pontivivens insulae]
MTIPALLIGILGGFAVFAAMFWSLWQAVMQKGIRRIAHLAAVLATLAGMASISLFDPLLAILAGAVLLIAGAGLAATEKGGNRVLPLFQVIFALMLLAGLPFR